ncbi:AEC family transporter [Auraticoccus sp. F435]|uniref:AEC family transporter n=1 Tax=Auraticoccus cholistanensis TaxID=2656650 RepID=A0A6A9UQU8_9ACTN|nr:AEC family transporter [Auraticoccus cholistanensis]MVA74948.1 AEC family transporter [Auraticoccus cholistanensis]
MAGVLTGFATVVAVVLAGTLLAHLKVLDARGLRVIADVSFLLALPALMLLTISRVELDAELTANLAASAVSLLVSSGTYALVAGLVWRRGAGETLIGALTSGYVNAGNLGVAVAGFIVGDPAVVVPTLLVQLLLVQPASLVLLDHLAARGRERPADAEAPAPRRRSPWRRMVTNPLTVASAVGVLLAATGWRLPQVVEAPLTLLSGFAIPAMLLSYGVSLRLNPPPGRSGHNREVGLATGLKLVLQPVVAWGVASALGLTGPVLLGVVMTAALPSAQNIFLLSTRYRTGEAVAREVIAVTTMACLPVALVVTLLLG